MSPQDKFTRFLKGYFLNQPISIIEIGTASGLWTEHVLRNYPKIKTLYTIDPYKYFSGERYESGRPQRWHDQIKAVADKRLGKYNNLARIFKTSEEAYGLFRSCGIWVEVVYIDGNHNEEYVEFDVENYYHLVEYGGIFAGHDYNLPQVKKAVDDKFGDQVQEFKEERIWWVIKKDIPL